MVQPHQRRLHQALHRAPAERTHARQHWRQPQRRREVKRVQAPAEQQQRQPKRTTDTNLAGQRSDAAKSAATCLPQHAGVSAHAGGSANVCAKRRNGAPTGASAAAICQYNKRQPGKYGIYG